ncbi:MAG: hypothetical protein P1V35_02070, partial [Planctomycetota bacterium]|nr:hypothetical protein [Planctomycetota bacterium]
MGDFFSLRPKLFLLENSIAAYHSDPSDGELARRVLEDLLNVGWLDEAQAFSRSLPGDMDREVAMGFESEATLAKRCLASLSALMLSVDRGRPVLEPSDPVLGADEPGGKVTSLDALLRAVGQVLWSAGPRYFGERDKRELERRLVASPRMNFG